MKKWTYLVAACMLAGATPVFTGCVDNDEPAGITELRGAKAQLLLAKAEVEAAKVEYQKALAEHERANANLVQAQADWYAAQAEYENAKTEKDKLIWAEELKEKQAAVEAAIEASKASYAHSQLDLIQTQKKIALAKASLTEEEYKLLWMQVQDYNWANLRLSSAQTEYETATAVYEGCLEDYNNAKDNHWEKSRLEFNLKIAEYGLQKANEALEEAKELATMPEDVQAWNTRYEELKAEVEALEMEGTKLEVEKAEWYAENNKPVIDAEVLENEAKDKKVTLEAYEYTLDFNAVDIAYKQEYKDDEVNVYYNGYYDEGNDEYNLKDNSGAKKYVDGLLDDINTVEALKLDKNGLAWTQITVNQAKASATNMKKTYEDALAIWKNTIAGFNDGVTAKPELLTEAIAVKTAIEAYNTAVTTYNAAAAATEVAEAAAIKAGLTATEIDPTVNPATEKSALDETIANLEDKVEAEKNVDELAKLNAKLDAAKDYQDAIDEEATAKTAVTTKFDDAKGKFNAYYNAYKIDYDQWDVVGDAYNNTKGYQTVSAEAITGVITATIGQIQATLQTRSEDLYGDVVKTDEPRLVEVTRDELLSNVQDILSEYNSEDYKIERTTGGGTVLTTVPGNQLSEGNIELFFLDQVSVSDATSSTVNSFDFGLYGDWQQAESDAKRGEAIISDNGKAVDAALTYLNGVLDKAVGAEGVITKNNEEVQKLIDAREAAEAEVKAKFEETGLALEIAQNKADQKAYDDLMKALETALQNTINDYIAGSGITSAVGWEDLQEQLDMAVRLAEDAVTIAENRKISAEKALADFATGEYDELVDAEERLKAAEAELKAAQEEQAAALQALEDAINSVLAAVQ